jgi:hypothetical protein
MGLQSIETTREWINSTNRNPLIELFLYKDNVPYFVKNFRVITEKVIKK